MFWDLSKLDNNEGIVFRNKHLHQVVNQLRPLKGGEVVPESIFWLLLTGHVPTPDEKSAFIKDLTSRMEIDAETIKLIQSFPKDLHPMAKLSAGMLLLQKNSHFAKA